MPINLITDPNFSVQNLSAAIENLPAMYGRVREMGLFAQKRLTTRTIIIEERNGVLTLIPSGTPGAPASAKKTGKRKVRTFTIPHFPLDATVLASEVEGVRSFGTDNELQTVLGVVNDKLQDMKNQHLITHEHLFMGALRGDILDADGSTIYNLFSEFGIVQSEVDFALGTTTTKVRSKCLQVKRLIEKSLGGANFSEVRVTVDESFFDKLVNHADVKDAYARWQNGDALRNDMRKFFPFGGLVFEEYPGTATDPDGNARKFIATDYGHAFPVGTLDTFQEFIAPGIMNETVNTLGQEFYARVEEMKHGAGYEIHTESNVLGLCTRPAVLVKVKTSN